MPTTMRFKSTPTQKTYLHRRGGREPRTYSDGRQVDFPVPAILLRDGDTVEMDDSPENDEVAWALTHYPDNFEKVGEQDGGEVAEGEPEGEAEG